MFSHKVMADVNMATWDGFISLSSRAPPRVLRQPSDSILFRISLASLSGGLTYDDNIIAHLWLELNFRTRPSRCGPPATYGSGVAIQRRQSR